MSMGNCLEGMVVAKDFPYVGSGFPNAGDFVIFDSMHTGVVRGKGQAEIPFIQIQQVPKLLRTPADVLDGIIRIRHTERFGHGGRELHEPDRAFARNHVLTKVRLRFDDGSQEGWVEPVLLGVVVDGSAYFLLGVTWAVAVVI
jgi:hypothetical protein